MEEKNKYYLKVVFFNGKSLISKIIKFFTRSKFSHAAFLIDDASLLEAWKNPNQKNKVQWFISTFNNHTLGTEIEIIYIPVTKKCFLQFYELCNFIDFVKIPYDFIGVFAFLIPFKLKINGHWFCSEGVYEILRYLKIIKNDVPGWKINPDDLYTILSSVYTKKEIKVIGED